MYKYLPYLNIPYQHMGRSFEGADCWGLVKLFYQMECGIDLPDIPITYPENWWNELDIVNDYYKYLGFSVGTGTPMPNDVITFYNSDHTPGHVGIVFDEGRFLHMTGHKACISSYLFGYWAKRVHGHYRYVG